MRAKRRALSVAPLPPSPDWRAYTSATHRGIDRALGWQRDNAGGVRPQGGEPDAWRVGVSERVRDKVDWLRAFQESIVRLGHDCEVRLAARSGAPVAVVRPRVAAPGT